MKRIIPVMVCFLLVLAGAPHFSAGAEEAGIAYLYVSPSGNDGGDGSINNPFATVIEARDKIRQMKKEGVSPEKGFVVYLREGDHQFTQSLMLTEEDSGTESAPVVYCAYPGENVSIVGGASLPADKFSKVTDAAILERIVDEAARSMVVSVDLKELGFTQYGEPYWPGQYSYMMEGLTKPAAASPELFINGEVQTLARYPNEGYMQVGEIHDPGAYPRMWEPDTTTNPEHVKEEDRDPTDTFEITPNDNRYLKWTKAPENDILMYGFWRWDWADHTVPVKKIYPEEKKLESGVPSWYSVVDGARFYAFNLLEEIDMPGEYYLDRQTGILYLYPPVELGGADIKFSLLEDHLIHIDGANYVTIKGVKMTAARSTAVTIDKGTGNRVVNCEIEYTAGKAVSIKGPENYQNGVIGCYIHDVNGGVVLDGGDIPTLTPGGNYALNNHIERFARINKTYNAAVHLSGVGNIAAYNEMNDAMHLAIQFSGNNHKIYYNNIHDVVKENDDMGAIYTGRSWIERGTEIKYNYIHDLSSTVEEKVGIYGIYLDDRYCEVTMAGNLFENIKGAAIFVNGGRDNIILNNILVNVRDQWKFTAISTSDPTSDLSNHMPGLERVPYREELWKNAYPNLYNILEDDPAMPKNNIIRNNLAVKSGAPRIAQGFAAYMDMRDNYETNAPGFYDEKSGNYLLTEDSPVFDKIPGFKQLPVTRMGTYSDRALARVREAVVLAVNSPLALAGENRTQIDAENEKVVPKIIDGSTFVPLRFLAEALGAEVSFEEEGGRIAVLAGGTQLSFSVGETAAVKNGETVTMEKAAFIEEGRTLVPLRAFSELFNKQVFWEDIGLIVIGESDDLFHKPADDLIINHLYQSISAH